MKKTQKIVGFISILVGLTYLFYAKEGHSGYGGYVDHSLRIILVSFFLIGFGVLILVYIPKQKISNLSNHKKNQHMEEKDSNQERGFNDLLKEAILPKIELIALVILVVATAFKFLHFNGSEQLLVISFCTLSAVYFLYGFAYVKEGSAQFDLILSRIGFIASSIVLVGTMFIVLRMTGGNQMIIVGTPVLIMAILISLYKSSTKQDQLYRSMFTKFSTALLISAVFYFFVWLVSIE